MKNGFLMIGEPILEIKETPKTISLKFEGGTTFNFKNTAKKTRADQVRKMKLAKGETVAVIGKAEKGNPGLFFGFEVTRGGTVKAENVGLSVGVVGQKVDGSAGSGAEFTFGSRSCFIEGDPKDFPRTGSKAVARCSFSKRYSCQGKTKQCDGRCSGCQKVVRKSVMRVLEIQGA